MEIDAWVLFVIILFILLFAALFVFLTKIWQQLDVLIRTLIPLIRSLIPPPTTPPRPQRSAASTTARHGGENG